MTDNWRDQNFDSQKGKKMVESFSNRSKVSNLRELRDVLKKRLFIAVIFSFLLGGIWGSILSNRFTTPDKNPDQPTERLSKRLAELTAVVEDQDKTIREQKTELADLTKKNNIAAQTLNSNEKRLSELSADLTTVTKVKIPANIYFQFKDYCDTSEAKGCKTILWSFMNSNDGNYWELEDFCSNNESFENCFSLLRYLRN